MRVTLYVATILSEKGIDETSEEFTIIKKYISK
jgi:hypothetical protein